MKRPILPEEIYKPKSELESKTITDRFIQMWSNELKRKDPSVLRVIFNIYGTPLLFWGLTFSLLESVLRLVSRTMYF